MTTTSAPGRRRRLNERGRSPHLALAGPSQTLTLWWSDLEPAAVHHAASAVLGDAAVLCPRAPSPERVSIPEDANVVVITIDTLHELAARGDLQVPHDLGLATLADPTGTDRPRWEAFLIQPMLPAQPGEPGTLWIVGSDRRGAVFGLYRFIEQLGMSPWVFWADALPRPRTELVWTAGVLADHPAVRYRGIFLNDEELLEEWAIAHTSDSTIGPETYARICQLLLRLGGNYLWPAMHVGAFNADPRNARVAHDLGVVVGTSHCDMLGRCNQHEWEPWLRSKGYVGTAYDYSIDGENRARIGEYWRECVRENAPFEVSWTLGMRGIHDSGFATSEIDRLDLDPVGHREAQKALLTRVITDQLGILETELGDGADGGEPGAEPPLTTFVPYKEVLPIYDAGLELPDDVTIVWPNDSFGYLRRLPDASERRRRGGHGLYYHSSYWAHPGMSYLYLGNSALALMVEQLERAWDGGIQTLWVDNVGALKPLELETELFLRAGWRAGRSDAITTATLPGYLRTVLLRDVPGLGDAGAAQAGDAVLELGRLLAVRRIEHLTDDVARVDDDDEAARWAQRLEALADRVSTLLADLPREQQNTFYQLVGRRTLASWLLVGHHAQADRSRDAHTRGHLRSASTYAARSRAYRTAWRTLTHHDNHTLAAGRWRGIVQPEHFAPPVTPHDAAAQPALELGPPALAVRILAPHGPEHVDLDPWGAASALLEVVNTGSGTLRVQVAAGAGVVVDGVEASTRTLDVEDEQRLSVGLTAEAEVGELTLAPAEETATIRRIVVRRRPATLPDAPAPALAPTPSAEGGRRVVEGDGLVSLPVAEVEEAELAGSGWRRAAGLGRFEDDCLVADDAGGSGLTYRFLTRSEGPWWLHVFRAPTLDPTGRLRVVVEVDGEPIVVESQVRDEWQGRWREVVVAGVEVLSARVPDLAPGAHTVRLRPVDRGVSVQWLAVSREPTWPRALPPRAGRLLSDGPALEPLGHAPWQPSAAWLGPLVRLRGGGLPLEPAVAALEPPELLAGLDVPVPHGEPGRDGVFTRLAERPADVLTPAPSPGAIALEAAATLSGTAHAWHSAAADGTVWEHVSAGGEAVPTLAMRVPPGFRVDRPADAPGLHHRVRTSGGTCTWWALLWLDGESTGRVALEVDGSPVVVHGTHEDSETGVGLWTYSTEHLWHWRALARVALPPGEHVLTVRGLDGGLRLERMYLTPGNETPPSRVCWPAADQT